MSYEKQVWSKYDALKSEEENIENGAVVTDNRMNHMEDGISNSDDNLASHVADTNNPHKVTAAQAGLGNVQNFGLATENEAKQGASNAKYMTPSLTQAVLSANINSVAYANSADGTNGFTTVYPNLNLLDGTRDFSGAWINPGEFQNNGTYKGLSVKKITGAWNGVYKEYTVTREGDYTASAFVKTSGAAGIYRFVKVNGVDLENFTRILGGEFDWEIDHFTIENLKPGDVIRFVYNISSTDPSVALWVAGYKWEFGSTATPWMPSASEVTADDWPKFVGFSNTVKTNKSASDYVWFPDLTNKVEDHINNRSNPHGVTASQVGSYTKSEVATLISEAIKQSKLDANPIGTILTTISNTNPSTYIGGTWERFANGRTLVGVDENDSVTLMNTANNIGGLVNPNTKHAHNFAKVGSQQSYTYAWGTGTYATSQVYLNTGQIAAGAAPNNNLFTRQSSDLSMTVEVGDNTDHNNWQPFVTVYFWRRTA